MRSPTFELVARNVVPRPLAEVFAYFSDALHLQELTPPWLHFRVLTPVPIVMRGGLLIDYRIRLRGLPMRWQSRITVWEPGKRFVDEQTRGPYRYWIHEHRFRQVSGGTECEDVVRYGVPGGRLVHRLLVRRDLERIFRYRKQALARALGAGVEQEVLEIREVTNVK